MTNEAEREASTLDRQRQRIAELEAEVERLRRHAGIIRRRLDGLFESIKARDWDGTEFAYDQVWRALRKLEALNPQKEVSSG